MIKQWLSSIFGPLSSFDVGDSVQLSRGDKELMVVTAILLNAVEPHILCQWVDSKTKEKREQLFPQSALVSFDWYRHQEENALASIQEQNCAGNPREANHTGLSSAAKDATDGEVMNGLDGIDVSLGLFYMKGNKGLYKDLLLKFYGKHEHFVEELKKKMGAGEIDEARRMVHTMKGLTGSLGMIDLHDRSKQLEEDLRGGRINSMHQKVMLIEHELNRVLKSIMENVPMTKLRTNEHLADKILPRLKILEDALRNHNPQAIHQLKEIGKIRGYEVEMDRLMTAATDYDFETALTTLYGIEIKISGASNADIE